MSVTRLALAMLLCCGLEGAAVPAAADEQFLPADVMIRINHRDYTMTRTRMGIPAEEVKTIYSDNVVELRKDHKLVIIVDDPNPLLYEYSIDKVVKVSADYVDSALTFAKAVGGLVNAFRTGGATDVTRALDFETPDRAVCFDISQVEVNQLNGALQSLARSAEAIPALIVESNTNEAKVKQAVAGWELAAHAATIDAIYRKLPLSYPQDQQSCQIQLALLQSLEPKIRDLQKRLKDFESKVDAIGKRVVLQTFDYSINKNQIITIKIDRSSTWSSQITNPRNTGSFTITLKPYAPLRLSVGAAMVYSFVRTSEFTAPKEASGNQFTITEKSSQYSAYSVGALLQITPRVLDWSTFSANVHLGITSKNHLGFLFGGGFQSFGFFNLGGGLILQQVDVLSGGAAVGDKLDDPSTLTTEKEFHSGFYLHLTASFPN